MNIQANPNSIMMCMYPIHLGGLGGAYMTVVDEEDWEQVNYFNWTVVRFSQGNGRTVYAERKDKENRVILLHNYIMRVKGVDHRNGDGLDNRRSNLRVADKSKNGANQIKWSGTYSSLYKGVAWRKDICKWKAQIMVNRQHMHLGSYEDEIDAALAYDQAARKFFGEFACVNFPRDGERCCLVAEGLTEGTFQAIGDHDKRGHFTDGN